MAIGTPTTLGTSIPGTDGPWNFNTTAVTPSDAKIIVVAGMVEDSAQSTAVMSGGGLSWSVDSEVGGVDSGVGWTLGVYSAHAPSGLASATTLTLTPTAGDSLFGALIGACYVDGLASASFVDVVDGQFRATPDANWDTTATTTTNADDLVIGGAYKDQAVTSTATGGATELFDFQNGTLVQTLTVTYKILSSTASTSLTGTWSSGTSNTDMAIFVAYKAAAGAAAAGPQRTFNAIPFMY